MKRSRWRVLGESSLAVILVSALAAVAQEAKNPATADLSTRYRFLERPSVNAGPQAEGVVGAYRVALRETLTKTTDQPQGAPIRKDRTIQATYQERPAEISPLDDRRVIAAVRRYETVTMNPEPENPPARPRLFQDLTVWYDDQPGEAPRILSLVPNRPLRDLEYLFAARQVFVPDLVLALPELPLRVGDTYPLSRGGMEALVGSRVHQGGLTSKLLSIGPDPSSPAARQIAVFDIVGRVAIDMGLADVHAQLRFACTPAPDKAAAGARGSTIFDAPGRITRLSIAHEVEGGGVRTREGQSPRFRVRRELVLRRDADNPGPPLPIPDPVPTPSPENSWLSYEDPQGRFQFQHPQELQPTLAQGPDAIRLERPRRDSTDIVTIQLTTRADSDPDAVRKGRFDAWRQEGVEAIAGAADWLPEAQWPGQRVYRFEAAVTGRAPDGGAQGRVQFYGYIIQTGTDQALYVEAISAEDPPTAFRDQVERMLKTFRLSGAASPKPAGSPPRENGPATATPE
jgi:hypothetical protein